MIWSHIQGVAYTRDCVYWAWGSHWKGEVTKNNTSVVKKDTHVGGISYRNNALAVAYHNDLLVIDTKYGTVEEFGSDLKYLACAITDTHVIGTTKRQICGYAREPEQKDFIWDLPKRTPHNGAYATIIKNQLYVLLLRAVGNANVVEIHSEGNYYRQFQIGRKLNFFPPLQRCFKPSFRWASDVRWQRRELCFYATNRWQKKLTCVARIPYSHMIEIL